MTLFPMMMWQTAHYQDQDLNQHQLQGRGQLDSATEAGNAEPYGVQECLTVC